MFNKVSRLAEQAATGLSRRAFLARLGLAPLAAAVFASVAVAGKSRVTCTYLGGCCGGGYPYLGVTRDSRGNILTAFCYTDRLCSPGNATTCTDSTCCGGAGACDGMVCYSDDSCTIPC